MKRSHVFLISFVSLFLFSVPLFGQSKSIETFLLDGFDTASAVNAPGFSENGATFNWTAQGSRFITTDEAKGGPYPKIRYVAGIPNALKQTRLTAEGDPEPQVLGAQVKFDRRADNWFEIYPVNEAGDPYGIPMLTTVQNIDFWVWGANYNYTLEVLLRDSGGVVHVLPAGSLKFQGWKNVIINIPSKVQQKVRQRGVTDVLRFVGFRIRTSPQEWVDDFVIYFDQIKYTSSILENIYDGYELRNTDFNEGAGQ
jgi:hypothetical protein